MSGKKYNSKHIGVRRIRKEMKELFEDKSIMYRAAADEDNIFSWNFVIRGPPDTDFEGGVYCGRIQLPHDYPYKPPNIILDTPNGRFCQGQKICLSISAYHPEQWHPAWGVRTILEALISFFPTPGMGAVAALDWPSKDRKLLAKRSHQFNLDNNLYKSLEPLLPASKEEILEAAQNFCPEAKDTAAMSAYAPSGASPAKAAAGGAGAAAAAAPHGSDGSVPHAGAEEVAKDTAEGNTAKKTPASSFPRTSTSTPTAAAAAAAGRARSPTDANTGVRRRTTATSGAGSGSASASATTTVPAGGQTRKSWGVVGVFTCLLVLLLIILLVRKFTKATV